MGLVSHTCNPSYLEAEQKDSKFKASLAGPSLKKKF
jgi:hypothetical protein